jgi:hypothetical protein
MEKSWKKIERFSHQPAKQRFEKWNEMNNDQKVPINNQNCIPPPLSYFSIEKKHIVTLVTEEVGRIRLQNEQNQTIFRVVD